MQKSIKFLCFVLIALMGFEDAKGYVTDTFLLRPSIYLSINPLNHNLDINWFNLSPSDLTNATIVITNDANDPNYENTLYDIALNSTEGRVSTFYKKNFTEIDEESECYDFWWSYFVNGEKRDKGCFKTNKNWMANMKNLIKNRRVRELFVPGTHDSASFKKKFDPEVEETLITKYTLTQFDDVKSQLEHGIRYLDLRVGYYRSNANKFWANHGISRLHPLTDILQQVKDFIDSSNEIVILDLQEFPVGFQNKKEIHDQFVMFLTEELGNYAAHPAKGWETTLDEIWRSGNRIIVAYDHYAVASEHSETFLFHSVRQRWGKVKEGFSNLESFLRKQRGELRSEPGFSFRPYAEMAELTPEALDVFTDRYGGLRKMANSINFQVSKLYHGEFGKNANVVVVDFYLATNIVDIAIEWNKQKFGESTRK